LISLVTPGSASCSASASPWLWSEETLPKYWPVCNFALILSVLFLVAFDVLTSIAPCHLPLYLYQCIAISFQILVLFVSFNVHSEEVEALLCALVNYLNNRSAYGETTALWYVPHRLKPLRRSENICLLHNTAFANCAT